MPDTSTHSYQMVGFHFKVTFESLPTASGGGTDVDIRFQSVTGLDVQIETESIKEGGENRFVHNYPVRRKYADLVLKRGLLLPDQSALTRWCQDAFQNMKVVPLTTVNIMLLNENHEPLAKWKLAHVWPKNWKIAEFNAERSEVLIETLELNYNRYEYSIP